MTTQVNFKFETYRSFIFMQCIKDLCRQCAVCLPTNTDIYTEIEFNQTLLNWLQAKLTLLILPKSISLDIDHNFHQRLFRCLNSKMTVWDLISIVNKQKTNGQSLIGTLNSFQCVSQYICYPRFIWENRGDHWIWYTLSGDFSLYTGKSQSPQFHVNLKSCSFNLKLA